jgi:hypothetical protein
MRNCLKWGMVYRLVPGTWVWNCDRCENWGNRTNHKDAFLAMIAHLKQRHPFYWYGRGIFS